MMSEPGKIKAPKTELPKDENDGHKKMGFNCDPSTTLSCEKLIK